MKNISKLVSRLGLEEKINLLTGHPTLMASNGVPSNGIPPVTMADATMGVRTQNSVNLDGAVCFPCAAAMASTWNRELLFSLGEAIAKECINESKDLILGPGINIKRTPRCGRNFEYFSEDPYLAGELAAEYVKGVQSLGVGTSLKHFALNNQEMNRDYISVEADERTIREIYLAAFETVVKKAFPTTVMSSYNKINSVYASENKYFLTDILRGEWGYDGVIISDWDAVHNIGYSIKAGLDIQMPINQNIQKEVQEALENGIITEDDIDASVARILRFLLESNPQKIEYNRKNQHMAAKAISDESICLLKNENILPIDTSKYKKINIVGEYAMTPCVCGGGSAQVEVSKKAIDSPFECIKKHCPEEIEVCYIDDVINKDSHRTAPLFSGRSRVLHNVKKDDLTIVFCATQDYLESEAIDRAYLTFDAYTDEFLRILTGCCDNVIVVMQSGGAVIPCQWHKNARAILQMWFAGEAGGSSIADILFGCINPSGKLSETFMLKENEINYPGEMRCVSYDEKWRIGYRYYDLHPEEIWFAFGHGLSYTDFEYSGLTVEVEGETAHVRLKVKNIGKRAGKETVQLYVHDLESSVSRPQKELKGFKKINLLPGEEKEVRFELGQRAFAFYNVTLKKWYVESGDFLISVGSSSRDIRLKKRITIQKNDEYTMKNYTFSIIG